jgi:hypothetical protein
MENNEKSRRGNQKTKTCDQGILKSSSATMLGEWKNPDSLIKLQGWARDGLSEEQIAANIGIHRNTLREWKKRCPEIAEAIREGKEVVDYIVENALLKEATSGNVTAQIFWLKNRKPKEWRDKVDFDPSAGEAVAPVAINIIAQSARVSPEADAIESEPEQ